VATELMLKDPGVTEYTITDLAIFTQYLVSLQVVNPEGEGPRSTVVVMTDEGSKSYTSYFIISNYCTVALQEILIATPPPPPISTLCRGVKV
jgi:hypothetical protein